MKFYKSTADGTVEFSEEDYAIFYADQARAMAEVPVRAREKRNELLGKTDWSQSVDTPQAIRDTWAPYRQALRDVPQQTGFPENVQWPTQPE
jgi:hypothetical protein